MSRTKQAARITEAVLLDLANRAHDERAERLFFEGWCTAERIRNLPERQLRANLRSLLEMRDFIEQALDAAIPDRGGDDA